jgi:hypothetical protein
MPVYRTLYQGIPADCQLVKFPTVAVTSYGSSERPTKPCQTSAILDITWLVSTSTSTRRSIRMNSPRRSGKTGQHHQPRPHHRPIRLITALASHAKVEERAQTYEDATLKGEGHGSVALRRRVSKPGKRPIPGVPGSAVPLRSTRAGSDSIIDGCSLSA